MPDRELTNATPAEGPTHHDVQQLIEAESGKGTQGIKRAWQASDSARLVLTSDANGVRISRDNGATPPAQVIVDGTAAGGQLSGTYPNPSLSAATIDLLVPPGTVWAYAGASPPSGWLACNGAAVSRTTYAKLFAAIGTNYNIGGEAGTDFRVPDLVGRVVLGTSGSHPRGERGGFETADGPAHTHPGPHNHGTPAHAHDISGHAHAVGHTHAAQHAHTLSGHSHQVDVDHDHPNAAAAAGASGSTLNGRFTAGGANALPDAHTHPVDIPSLGVTMKATLGPSAPNTDTSSQFLTNEGVASPTKTGTSDAATTGTANPTTDDASPAHSASYVGTIATMPPFGVCLYIIRTG